MRPLRIPMYVSMESKMPRISRSEYNYRKGRVITFFLGMCISRDRDGPRDGTSEVSPRHRDCPKS